MKFEIFCGDNRILFQTEQVKYIPNDTEIKAMIKNGYKFKIDGKSVNKKKIDEIIQKEKLKNEKSSTI